MWEEMWENTSENPLFIYKIQYLMRWFGTSPATTLRSEGFYRNPYKYRKPSVLSPRRPRASGSICLQPEGSVGEVWGKIGFPHWPRVHR